MMQVQLLLPLFLFSYLNLLPLLSSNQDPKRRKTSLSLFLLTLTHNQKRTQRKESMVSLSSSSLNLNHLPLFQLCLLIASYAMRENTCPAAFLPCERRDTDSEGKVKGVKVKGKEKDEKLQMLQSRFFSSSTLIPCTRESQRMKRSLSLSPSGALPLSLSFRPSHTGSFRTTSTVLHVTEAQKGREMQHPVMEGCLPLEAALDRETLKTQMRDGKMCHL